MSMRIQRILFPTDFSETSKEAAQYAMSLADQFDAELHLLHVVSQVMPYGDASSVWIEAANETQIELEAAEAAMVEHVLDREWSATHRVFRTTVVGFTVDEILSYADKHDVDLIVVGTHGYTWLAHSLIGSVAEKLVRLAKCPVLTVHPTGRQFVMKEPAANESAVKTAGATS